MHETTAALVDQDLSLLVWPSNSSVHIFIPGSAVMAAATLF